MYLKRIKILTDHHQFKKNVPVFSLLSFIASDFKITMFCGQMMK